METPNSARRALKAAVSLAVAAALCASIAACSGSGATPSSSGGSEVVWLCRPGLANNPCEADLTATAVGADGSTAVESPAPAPAADQPIDCFYIYPTVSPQKTANSDLTIEEPETRAARAQASPFSRVCRVYAPMYRSLTSSAVNNLDAVTEEQGNVAYQSLADAFHEYMAKYNQGRGIVLIGHSQGAWMTIALLEREFDDNPDMRRQLVSAIAVGGNLAVPTGKLVGGDLASIPGCSSADQVGCVIAYSTFSTQPSPYAWFGRIQGRVNPFIRLDASGDLQVLCTNPARLGGGSGVLEPYILTEELDFQGIGGQTGIQTPWVTYPQEYSGQCKSMEGTTWLQVDLVNGDTEARPVIPQVNGWSYGLHNVDIAIALGNLVDLVGTQGQAFQG
jgi:pimeloyl-ACP methyl ester carboxylesterase